MDESKVARRGLDRNGDPRSFLQGLVQDSPLAFQVCRADGGCVLVNRAYVDLFGAAPPADYDLLRDDLLTRHGLLALVHRALGGETVRTPPLRVEPRAGDEMAGTGRLGVQVTLLPLRSERERVDHIALCFADVTAELDLAAERERIATMVEASRRSEEALQRSASRLQILAESSRQFSAASIDLGGLLELVARRMGEVIGGICAIRLIAKDGDWLESAATVYHPDPELRAAVQEILRMPQRMGEGVLGKVAATGQPMLVPAFEGGVKSALTPERFRSAVERIGVASVLAVPLRSRDRVLGAFSMSRTESSDRYTREDLELAQDLADRGALAIENAILMAELEERVSSRTAALVEANKELEAFSYTVSHDLRAPLRAIDGFSEALLTDCGAHLDDRCRDYLGRVRNGAQRMSELIDDFLGLARIHRTRIEPRPIDLGSLAREVLDEIRAREPRRSVDIAIGDGLSATGDPRLITIVLENLLGNAWKFTARCPDARIAFDLTEDRTAFYVRDNGTGFDMAYAGRLFTPFQRLHDASEFEGTGIGLATVQRILSRHGGRIWAEAAPGQGATFYFTLGQRPTEH